MSKKAKYVTWAGVTAALYVVLTMISTAMGLSSGAIQVRFSESLCILPVFFPAAIPGLFVGCIISNLLSGCVMWDIIFGSIATLIGAIGTSLLKKNRFLACLPPIISNTVIVPFVLVYAYGIDSPIWLLMLTVGAGEVISIGILGQLVYWAFKRTKLSL